MNKISLSSKEKAVLESRHKQCRDKRECDRIKALLLADEGWTCAMISQALRIHETSVTRHINDYVIDKKLMPNSGGSEGYLSEIQTQDLVEHLYQVTYLHAHQIAAYIKDTYGIEYSVAGLNKWLHQHGFSYKQPKSVPHKLDADKQAAVVEEDKALKASLNDDEPLLFMDAVHPTQATKITAGWIKKGVDKPIETTGSRTRLNIIGAIRLDHLEDAQFNQFKTINGESIIEFLNQINDFYKANTTIHLVLDCASYHRSKIVVEEAEKLNIKLHYLPPYSPNLNPIERLWKVMNKKARNNKYFAKPKLFRQAIDEFLEKTLPDIADSLGSVINDNFQMLKPAF